MKTILNAVDLSRSLGVLLHPFSGLWPATPTLAALWLHTAILIDSTVLLVSLLPVVMFRLSHADPSRLRAATRTVLRWLKRGLWASSAVTIGLAGASLFSEMPALIVLIAAHVALTGVATAASVVLVLAPPSAETSVAVQHKTLFLEMIARICALVEIYCIIADRPTLAFQAAVVTLAFWLMWQVMAIGAARTAQTPPNAVGSDLNRRGQPDAGRSDAFLTAIPAARDLRNTAQSATIIAFPTQDRLARPRRGGHP